MTWGFTVDPTAATGIMPLPTVSPVAGASAFTSVTPFRFADSRITLRSTKLTANVPKRIQIAGIAGLPSDATGFSANITTTDETGVGYLTVYNCTAVPPTASTLNFYPSEPVGNAGLFPLGPSGEICLVASKDANVIIDVTGYLRPSAIAALRRHRADPAPGHRPPVSADSGPPRAGMDHRHEPAERRRRSARRRHRRSPSTSPASGRTRTATSPPTPAAPTDRTSPA